MKSEIWIEKYKPKTLDDVIFSDLDQRVVFDNFVKNKNIPNLLFYGIPGTGKSSTSNALIADLGIYKCDVMRINCSDEKIDAIRNKVADFAGALFSGPFNVVQLEECDYLSLEAMALLRGLIDDSNASCRFIATCNYVNKIIPALRSRFQEFSFGKPDKELFALRLDNILRQEHVSYESDTLLSILDATYPDIRKAIQTIQTRNVNSKLSDKSIKNESSSWESALISEIHPHNLRAIQKIVFEDIPTSDREKALKFLFNNIQNIKCIEDPDSAAITIAEYLYKNAFVADTGINLVACIISLTKCI